MNRNKIATAVLTAALCAGMALPAHAAINPFAQMENDSRQAVEAAIKAGTIPPDSTIYDCMYGTDGNGTTIVIQYKDQNGDWIDVITQKPAENAPAAQSVDRLSEETLAEYAAEVFRLVNVEREKVGLEPLERNVELDAAADTRANECVSVKSTHIDGIAHLRPNGSSFETVLDDMGIEWHSVAENTAKGQVLPSDVMDAWLNSDGHSANIFTQKRTQIGIAVRQDSDGALYWIQIFIRP